MPLSTETFYWFVPYVLPPAGNYQLILTAVEKYTGKIISKVYSSFCVTGNRQSNCNADMSLDTYGPISVGNAVDIRLSPIAGATYDHYQLYAFSQTAGGKYYYTPVIISDLEHFTVTKYTWTTKFGLQEDSYYIVAIMFMNGVAVSTCQTPSIMIVLPGCIRNSAVITKPLFGAKLNAGNTSVITWTLPPNVQSAVYVSVYLFLNLFHLLSTLVPTFKFFIALYLRLFVDLANGPLHEGRNRSNVSLCRRNRRKPPRKCESVFLDLAVLFVPRV